VVVDLNGKVIVNVVGDFTESGLVASGSWDGAVKLWPVTTGTEIANFRGDTGSILSVAISCDSKTPAAAGQSGKIPLWNLK